MVSDNPGCGGWTFAQSEGIAVLQFPSKKHTPGEHSISAEALPAALQDLGIDFICLAGFLKVVILLLPFGRLLMVCEYRKHHKCLENLISSIANVMSGSYTGLAGLGLRDMRENLIELSHWSPRSVPGP